MSSKRNNKYWKNRKINWEQAYFNLDHPHREMLMKVLKLYPFESVLEIGCGAGANLYNIKKNFPKAGVSGCDINEDAIKTAKEKLPEADLKVGNAINLPFHGGKFDLILTDACLIYSGTDKIKRVLREIRRVGSRKGSVMFIEFHSESWFKRMFLRIMSNNRYFAYDYKKLLLKNYFKGIRVFKINEKQWPGHPWSGKGSYGYLILAII